MSAIPAAPPIGAIDPPVDSGHKDALREKHAHAGVAMAAATFAMAAASGIQAVLYLSSLRDRRPHRRLLRRLRALRDVRRLQPEHPGHLGAAAGRRPAADDRRASSPRRWCSSRSRSRSRRSRSPVRSPHLLAPGLDADGRVGHRRRPSRSSAARWCSSSGPPAAATLLAVRDRFDRVAVAYIAGAAGRPGRLPGRLGPRRRAVAGLVDAGDGRSSPARSWWPACAGRVGQGGAVAPADPRGARRAASGWCSGAPRSTSPSTRSTS